MGSEGCYIVALINFMCTLFSNSLTVLATGSQIANTRFSFSFSML